MSVRYTASLTDKALPGFISLTAVLIAQAYPQWHELFWLLMSVSALRKH